jgi:hypothetical protein
MSSLRLNEKSRADGEALQSGPMPGASGARRLQRSQATRPRCATRIKAWESTGRRTGGEAPPSTSTWRMSYRSMDLDSHYLGVTREQNSSALWGVVLREAQSTIRSNNAGQGDALRSPVRGGRPVTGPGAVGDV